MTVIDVHHHVWTLSHSPYEWLQAPTWDAIRRDLSYDDLRPSLLECGVDKSIIVQADNSAADCLHMRAVAAAQTRVAGYVGWVPLADSAKAASALDGLADDAKFVGVRHVLTFEADDDWVLGDEVMKSLALLAQRKLVFEVTCDRLAHLGHVAALARAHPDLAIVVNHIGKPPIATRGWQPWAGLLEQAAAYPNVAAKLSGLTTPYRPQWQSADFTPYIDHALQTFGARRLMFGSNWPVTLVAGSYRQQWDALAAELAALSDSERGAIYGANAERIYRLNR